MAETVASFRDPWEAHMLRARLAAEGIPATVAFEYHIGNNWLWSYGLGCTKVQVPNSRLDEALKIESDSRAGILLEELRAALGDIDDVKCPNCGSMLFMKRRPIPSILLTFVSLLVVGIPAFGWVYSCKTCGTKWQS
jgi:hypothetical protein